MIGAPNQMVETDMPSARETFPTQDRLRQMLSYDPKTGIFTWRVRVSNVAAGSVAGRIIPNGYRVIRLDDAEHYAHRLAWFYVHREVPPKYLRFRDKNRDNCRLENLYHVEITWKRSPDRQRAYDLGRDFGITVEEYQALFLAQAGVCAICAQPERDTRNGKVKWLAVDHDHETRAVRGLLCVACNTALGKMEDSADRLRVAADYLDRHAAARPDNVVPIRSA
jgi:hypothetical protein